MDGRMTERMTMERWRELLTAAPPFAPGDMERIAGRVYAPTEMNLSVRSALRRIALERRETHRHAAPRS